VLHLGSKDSVLSPSSNSQGRRMISLAHSCLWVFWGIHIPGSLSPSLKILVIIPKKQIYKRALQRRYLERTCVHACIQLCTRGYTVVYTRVYSCLLGRRYSLGISMLGHRYFYLFDVCSLTTLPSHYGDFMRQPSSNSSPLSTWLLLLLHSTLCRHYPLVILTGITAYASSLLSIPRVLLCPTR